MVEGITGFHHLGIITRSLGDTVSGYERLGFVFTPMSFPEFPLSAGEAPQTVGVANRNAVFRNGYLEMLGVIDATRWASISTSQRGPFDIDKPVQKYEGLHVMHFETEDIDGVHAKLISDGLRPSAIRPFQRLVETPEGTDLMCARCISFASEANPEALFQIVQHETPQLALQPRFMTHRNGALDLSAAILCVEDPADVAARYAHYSDRHVEHQGSLLIVNLGTARLVIIKREHLPVLLPGETAPITPYFAGFTVTADLDLASTFLNHQAIPFRSHDGRIIISAGDAFGSAIVFERPQASQPAAIARGADHE